MPTYSTHKLAAFAKLTEEVETQKTWTPFSPSLLFLHQIFFIMIFFHSLMPAKCGNSLRRVCDKYQFSTSLFLLLIHDGTRDLFNMLHLACLICLIQFSSISIEFFFALDSSSDGLLTCYLCLFTLFLLAHRFPMSGFFHFPHSHWSFKIKLHHLFSHIIYLVANAWNSSLPRCWRGKLLAQFLNSHTTSGALFQV